MQCIFPATPRSSRGLDEQSGQSPREFDRFPQGRPGGFPQPQGSPGCVNHHQRPTHTHTPPQLPRPGMPVLCTPALSAQPRPETRRDTVVIPTCLLRKPPSPWPLGAGGGTWSGKRRRERIIPGQRRLTVFGAQSSGRIFRKAGQLWCGTLSQLEADENESFQGRVKKKQKNTATIHKFRRLPWHFWLVSMFISAYRHLTQSTA